MSTTYTYLKKYMRSNYSPTEILKVGQHNVFYPLQREDNEKAELKMERVFPPQLRAFYLEVGFGHLTTPHDAPKEYDSHEYNLILPPNAAACFYKGQLCDDYEDNYMSEHAYEMLEPGDLPFFEIGDSCLYMIMKLNSDNPNAVWFIGGKEKIEDSFEQFIWNLYYKSPSYYD